MIEAEQSSSQRNGFLPNFCDVRTLLVVVISAELLALVLTLGAGTPPEQFWETLSLRSLYVEWIALTVAAVLCLLRAALRRCSHSWAGIIAWLVTVGVTVGVAEITYRLLPDSGGHLPFVIYSVATAAIMAALILRYLYEQQRERERALAESRARYDALQARIRPHFLFNSMNTIAGLTRSDPSLAEQVVQDLADLFRSSLGREGRTSTLGEELELARGYLRIEAQRLGARLRVIWDLEDLPLAARLPPLVLQPLLENAVYHGVEPAAAGGSIVVAGRFRRGVVNLSVRNSLPPGNSETHRRGNRVAVDNVRERLAALFGDAARLTLGEVDGEFQVRLVFPVQEGAR